MAHAGVACSLYAGVAHVYSMQDVTPSSITVLWGPVDCIYRNGDITGYTVRVRASGEAERTVSVDDSAGETTVSGLTPFTEYIVSVAAENKVDIGVYSNMITIRTQGIMSRRIINWLLRQKDDLFAYVCIIILVSLIYFAVCLFSLHKCFSHIVSQPESVMFDVVNASAVTVSWLCLLH